MCEFVFFSLGWGMTPVCQKISILFFFQTKTGCHVLYKQFPEMVAAKERKNALSDLNTQWRISGANKLIPDYLRKQLEDALVGTK